MKRCQWALVPWLMNTGLWESRSFEPPSPDKQLHAASSEALGQEIQLLDPPEPFLQGIGSLFSIRHAAFSAGAWPRRCKTWLEEVVRATGMFPVKSDTPVGEDRRCIAPFVDMCAWIGAMMQHIGRRNVQMVAGLL
jgi:hypothetical protein